VATMTRTVSASGMDWATLAAAVTTCPGLSDLVCPQLHAMGLRCNGYERPRLQQGTTC
jgi:hypothetical protein